MTFRLSVLGLDNSHPYVDVHHLAAQLGAAEVRVHDQMPQRVSRFLQEYPHARFSPSVADLLDSDALIVTLRPSMFLRVIDDVAASGLPTFVNKPGVTRMAHLEALTSALGNHPGHAIMSCSVLRFAPAAIAQRGLTWGDDVIVDVGHGTRHWEEPGNEWQAEANEGLGVMGAIGYHGLELLDAVIEGGLADCRVETVQRIPTVTAADSDVQVELVGRGGRATVRVVATMSGERYMVSRASQALPQWCLRETDGDHGLGYAGTMRAFAEHIRGDRTNGVESMLSSIRLACIAGEMSLRAPTDGGTSLATRGTTEGGQDGEAT